MNELINGQTGVVPLNTSVGTSDCELVIYAIMSGIFIGCLIGWLLTKDL